MSCAKAFWTCLTCCLSASLVHAQGLRATSVTGQVVSRGGHPVASVGVYLVLPDNGPVNFASVVDTAYTDSLGRFALRGPLQKGCYALFTAFIGFGRTVRTFVMSPSGKVDVGMVTLDWAYIPEMPTLFLRECERPGAGSDSNRWGVDTVAVRGKVTTAAHL